MTEKRVITSSQRRRAQRIIERQIAPILFVIDALTEDVIADVLARCEQSNVPDGYPSSSGAGGSASSDETSSTERAVVNRERVVRDPIGEAGRALFASLRNASASMKVAHRQVAVVQNAHVVRGRVSSLQECQACGDPVIPPARLRSGYCDACRKAWSRTTGADRDRVRFEQTRKQRAEETP